jgi:hypothetical protein
MIGMIQKYANKIAPDLQSARRSNLPDVH